MKTTITCKSKLFFILLAAFTLKAASQPLTNGTLPGIGSTYQFNQVTAAIIHPQAGANQTWNFNPLTNTALLTCEIIPKSSLTALDISTFPMANYYIKNYLNGTPLNVKFKEALFSKVLWLGQSLSGGGYDVNNPPQVDYDFGMVLGSLFTYPIAGGIITRTTKYDGYGTATTPFGTYNNVIRLKTTESGAGATNDTLFIYYRTSPVMMPLLQYTVSTAGVVDHKFIYNFNNIITAAEEPVLEMSKVMISPNPAIDHIVINNLGNVRRIEIYNAVMQKIKSCNVGNDNTFSVSDIKPGIYFIKTGIAYAKFVKQ